ncbi:hypothetical protein Mapa_005127 [Marchantia paleacea]|nr:hypothetical protein Mapa_005127 [Marchantia paleacea]
MAWISPSAYVLASSKFHQLTPPSTFLPPLPLNFHNQRSAAIEVKSRSKPCCYASFCTPCEVEEKQFRWESGLKSRIGGNPLRRAHFDRSVDGGSRQLHNAGRLRTMAVETIIGPQCGRTLFMILAACGAIGQLLEERTKWGGRLSAPLLAMGTGMLLSGTAIIPSACPAYDMVFSTILPLAAALTLLETDVWQAFGDAGATLKAFIFGALGTVLGTFVSFKIIGRFLGPDGWKIASCLCASYVGGSINYAATAQILGLTSGSMLAAGMAADNLCMALYFGVIMSIPDDSVAETSVKKGMDGSSGFPKEGPAGPTVESIAVSLAVAAAACTAGDALAGFLPSTFEGSGLALMAAVASIFNALAGNLCGASRGGNIRLFAGAQNMGQSLMLLFFAVVGASTGVKQAMAGGWPLIIFITVLVSVHLSTILLLGKLAKIPMRSILIASNANIGGPGTAAAMANSRSWPGLVRPALLVGTLGYTIGTAIGVLLGVHALQPMLKTFGMIM